MLTIEEMFQKVVNINPNLNRDTVKEVCNILIDMINKPNIELSFEELNTLRLITSAATCYADIRKEIENKMATSIDIYDLYLKLPLVQGTINKFALEDLAESNIDCSKIKSISDILEKIPKFKRYLADVKEE